MRPIQTQEIGHDRQGYWYVYVQNCPDCNRSTIWLELYDFEHDEETMMVYPKGPSRPPVPPEVPNGFAEDYREACLVITDSPKASAALSRRCLQNILREKAQVKVPNNLAQAIAEVVDDPGVPSDISASLDMVRNIGNFSAHPNKSTNTGEIVDVEPMEAEWCLETIEILFDFYFVRPADIEKRRQAVNSKLADIGKPQMPVVDQGGC